MKMPFALLGAVLAIAALAGPADAANNRRSAAPQARVVCGQTGCFNVPPGCVGEIRPSGRGGGVVAVVICPR